MPANKPKNLSASVQAKLLNRRIRTGENYENLLRRYVIEGFLRRLALSPHRERLILKGAMLFFIWGLEEHRATRDVDFLGFGELSLDSVRALFRDIVCINGCEDGLVFLPETIQVELIREENEYGGTRVLMSVMLPPAKIQLQADIGMGDAVAECPVQEFPSLLESRGPLIRAYPKEISIAEKYHAIVELDMKNTRLKDFFDIWVLCNSFEFDLQQLTTAIRATFERRHQVLPKELPIGLSTRFSSDLGKQLQWNAFLRKSGIAPPNDDFGEVVERVARFLEPIREEIIEPYGRIAIWKPTNGSWIAL